MEKEFVALSHSSQVTVLGQTHEALKLDYKVVTKSTDSQGERGLEPEQ